jgi:pyruvate formate lyase activating enzyme
MRRGLVFNIQKYSVQDGPGIRTTVFLKGCPLRCVWCHNPEGIASEREIVVLETRCIACAECRRACRFTDEQPGEGPLPALHASCDLCGRCIEACPTQARQIIGKEMTVDQVLRVVLEDRLFYEESGGGVTFSGGEPLLQADFLRQALAACKDHGLKTAVDTCGLAAWEQLASVVPLADLFLFDVKFASDAKHRQYTGVSNQLGGTGGHCRPGRVLPVGAPGESPAVSPHWHGQGPPSGPGPAPGRVVCPDPGWLVGRAGTFPTAWPFG